MTFLGSRQSLERMSEHPLGQAIIHAAKERHLVLADVKDFANVAGKGIRASWAMRLWLPEILD